MTHFLYPISILLALGGSNVDGVARPPLDSEVIVKSGGLDKQAAQELLER